MSGKGKYHAGEKYGYLTLLEDTGERSRQGSVKWKCKCDCGKIVYRTQECIRNSMKKGCAISCGCKKDKSVGKRLAFDKDRIEKARKAIAPYDGTTMQGIGPQKIRKNNTSGYRGVSFMNREQKWAAQLLIRGKQYRKLFDRKEDAIKYRQYLEKEYFDPIREEYKSEQNRSD